MASQGVPRQGGRVLKPNIGGAFQKEVKASPILFVILKNNNNSNNDRVKDKSGFTVMKGCAELCSSCLHMELCGSMWWRMPLVSDHCKQYELASGGINIIPMTDDRVHAIHSLLCITCQM